MFDKIIYFSIHNKLVVGLMVAMLAAWGVYSATHLPLDAVPDITNNQVQVVTVSPALAPQEVEKFITYPVEIAMANLPGVEMVRSISRYGLSVVTIIFEEDFPTLDARQLVNEKLVGLQGELDARLGLPYMMPITTGLGEIYQYTLEVEPGYESKYNAMELRSIQDWLVKRRMAGVNGVVDVSSFGGFLKQYEVAVDAEQLRSFNLTIAEVFDAVQQSNGNAGGSYIEKGPQAYYIRAEGLLQSPNELKEVVVGYRGGLPVKLGQVAQIGLGSAIRYGAMTQDGKGEAVGGIVLMLKGANASETLTAVHERMDEIKKSLPEGVRLVPFLDRSVLVNKVIGTVSKNLVEGGLIVVFILILLMGNLRAGLVVASVIPLAMLFALSMMRVFGVSANLMSLGAIDFGLIVERGRDHRGKHRPPLAFAAQRPKINAARNGRTGLRCVVAHPQFGGLWRNHHPHCVSAHFGLGRGGRQNVQAHGPHGRLRHFGSPPFVAHLCAHDERFGAEPQTPRPAQFQRQTHGGFPALVPAPRAFGFGTA